LSGESFAATLTPATAILLFNLTGVLTRILTGWRGLEEVVALYAAHQDIIKRWMSHATKVNRLQKSLVPDRERMTLSEFDRKLETCREEDVRQYNVDFMKLSHAFATDLNELCVYRLKRQLQSPKGASVFIPVVGKNAIMVNADRASFADVIAHKQLLQAKHTQTPDERLEVDLADEMRKCGLLKVCKNDRALRGLLALWDGTLPAPPPETRAVEIELASESASLPVAALQRSRAFPSNMIEFRQPYDGIKYWEVDSRGKVKGTSYTLPGLPQTLNMTFVLCTNAKALNLRLTPRSKKDQSNKTRRNAPKGPKPRKAPSKMRPSTLKDAPLLGRINQESEEPSEVNEVTVSETKGPDVFLSIKEEHLDENLLIDVDKLNGKVEKERWANFTDKVITGVKLQFLFTSGP
jgi:hypothetical protein